jgi:hypothetical protein
MGSVRLEAARRAGCAFALRTPGEKSGLARALRLHAAENDALPSERNSYGQKYEVRGRIHGPSGKASALVAVWIILQGEEFPRFVTAFPGARS